MKNSIPKELDELASIFPSNLYIVGGFVRDSILGYKQEDIDICGEATPDQVKEVLKNTSFSFNDESKKFLTIKIKINNQSFEYTSFRVDSYDKGHKPETVKHTTDINIDATRRDFTINAIYYDVKNKKIVDPLNGQDDLKNKIIRTTREPELVFSEDGLRLMRLARFASALNFEIDESTLKAATKYSYLIDDISPERIKDELNKILVGDTTCGNKDAIFQGFKILRKTNVLSRILPDLADGYGLKQRADFHKYDVYFHTLYTVYYSPYHLRLAALFHDIGKPYCMKTYGKYARHAIEGEPIAKNYLTKYKYSNEQIKKTCALVRNHMFNVKENEDILSIRKFIIDNLEYFDDIIALKYADCKASGFDNPIKTAGISNLEKEYQYMIERQIPLKLADLLVDGNDLLSITELPPKFRSQALMDLLYRCSTDFDTLNTKEAQINYIKSMISSYI